jgi:hypothetical protein
MVKKKQRANDTGCTVMYSSIHTSTHRNVRKIQLPRADAAARLALRPAADCAGEGAGDVTGRQKDCSGSAGS